MTARNHRRTLTDDPFPCSLATVVAARQKLAAQAQVLNSGVIRAQALLTVFLQSTHQFNDAGFVIEGAIHGAQMLGYHLGQNAQPVLWYVLDLLDSFKLGMGALIRTSALIPDLQ